MKTLKKFEIWSVLGTIIFGSLLHFVFAWSGNFKPLALIAAVNESSWEHLKLAFWPAFIFALIAYYSFGKNVPNFCLAQAKKLYLMPILIIVLFYGWLLFFPDNFIYDISIFVVAVIAGHIVAYYIETSPKNWGFKTFSQIMIVLLLLAFSLLTFFAPHNFLFLDPVSGGYGIVF
jgi:hypothetical protein